MPAINISLTLEQLQKLENIHNETGKSRSKVVQELLEKHLGDDENEKDRLERHSQ